MRNTKSAFTLVELIVVITILAILGTIAFISLQGYSADARNSKRTSDLNNIASSLNIKLTTGMGVMSLLADSANDLTSIDLAGATGIAAGSTYDAGTVNYAALGMKASEFQDPNGDNYVAWATTLAGGAYQLAASIEKDGSEVAKVIGNYNDRDTTAVAATAATGATLIVLDSTASVGTFKIGDTVGYGATGTGKISKISSDGMNITVDTAADATVSDIALVAAESAGLISSDGTSIVVEAGSVLPY